MIHSFLRIKIAPKRNSQALEILKPFIERIKVTPGCLDSRLYKDLQEEDVLMLEQRWRSEEDLNRHLRSREYQNVLLLMEMAKSRPEVCFEKIARTSGLETVEAARGCNDEAP
jgi:quinol monooxygenase YgiN